jgi:hypothetical protein
MFLLGLFTGLLIAILIVLSSLFIQFRFKDPVNKVVKELEEVAIPKVKGAIYLPPDDSEVARQKIINNNEALGKPTHISELYDEIPG